MKYSKGVACAYCSHLTSHTTSQHFNVVKDDSGKLYDQKVKFPFAVSKVTFSNSFDSEISRNILSWLKETGTFVVAGREL